MQIELDLEYDNARTTDNDYEDEFWVDMPQHKAKKSKRKKLLPSINNHALLNSKSAGSLHSYNSTTPCSAPTNEAKVLQPSRSWNNLIPNGSHRKRKPVLDRRPRVGWGYQNTSVEDVQDQLYNIKKNTNKVDKENKKLKCKIRRLEKDLRKREKTVQSLLTMAVDERQPQSCDLLVMLQQQQSETIALKKENTNLKKEMRVAEENIKELSQAVTNSHVNELNRNLEAYYEEILRLQKILQEQEMREAEMKEHFKQSKMLNKKFTKELAICRKSLTTEKRATKRAVKQSEDRLETVRSLKTKLQRSESRLEENLRTVTNLKHKMCRFERHFRKQMHGDSSRKMYYDIEKDMEKLRNKLYKHQKQSKRFTEALETAADYCDNQGIANICDTIGHWFVASANQTDKDDLGSDIMDYFDNMLATVEEQIRDHIREVEEAEEAERKRLVEQMYERESSAAKTRTTAMSTKKEQETAAVKIQAQYRGHCGRQSVQKRKEEEQENVEREAAALKIQSQFRGHRARKSLCEEQATIDAENDEIQLLAQEHAKEEDIEAQKSDDLVLIQSCLRSTVIARKQDTKKNEIGNPYVNNECNSEPIEEDYAEDGDDMQEKKASDVESSTEKNVEDVILLQSVLRSPNAKSKTPPEEVASQTEEPEAEENIDDVILLQSVLRSPTAKSKAATELDAKEVAVPLTEEPEAEENIDDVILMQSILRSPVKPSMNSASESKVIDASDAPEASKTEDPTDEQIDDIVLIQAVCRSPNKEKSSAKPQIESSTEAAPANLNSEEDIVLIQAVCRSPVKQNSKPSAEADINANTEDSTIPSNENLSIHDNSNSQQQQVEEINQTPI